MAVVLEMTLIGTEIETGTGRGRKNGRGRETPVIVVEVVELVGATVAGLPSTTRVLVLLAIPSKAS